jgi:hypothetical protein
MKKKFALALLISFLFSVPVLMAQNETKTGSVKRQDVKRSEATTQKPGETSTQKDPASASDPVMTSKAAAMDGQKFYDQTGTAMAAIAKDGTIRDTKGRILGTFTEKGEYLNPHGKKVGYVEDNIIRTAEGNIFATIREDGRVYDGKSQYMGTISDDGTVINSRGLRIGSAPDLDKSLAALMFFFPKNAPMPELRSVKKK